MSHTVALERRADGATSPVFSGEAVLPREAIRLSANNAMWGNVKFSVTDVHFPPKVLFGPIAVNIPPQGGYAYVDTHAPDEPGAYYVVAYNDLAFTGLGGHEQRLLFRADEAAKPAPSPLPAPPEPSVFPRLVGPGGLIPEARGLALAAAVLVGLLILGRK